MTITKLEVTDTEAAERFIDAIDLGGVPRSAQLREEEVPPPIYVKEGQALAVGSQILEFAANVPAELRPQIANSFTLAQLAANKTIEKSEHGSREWYRRYVEVLANTGWVVESDVDSRREVSGTGAQLHREILPIVTLALGPAVAAAAIVTGVLNGLANMDQNSPWITLFDRQTQRASANQFQVSYAEAPAGGVPSIKLTCFELDARRSVTQVLFFKFSQSEAVLSHFGAQLSLNAALFERVKAAVEDRLVGHTQGFIANIEI